ncbi:MAG: hypothetical protein M1153_00820 [Patescibacteria group bacterium]|nr:hypothetical protein [Patescibacteria group bacterium]
MKKTGKTEEISPEFAEKVKSSKKLRRKLAYEDPLWFALIYLPRYFQYPFAPFHLEMFRIIRKERYKFAAVMAFRGSGKSTVMNTLNVLWSILGKPEKKFAIIASKTQEQAKNHFANIKAELETNALLIEDFGPFSGSEAAWNKMSLELEYCGAKIVSVSRDQSVRGLRHGPHRPDLIVCDDLEDDEDKGGAVPIHRRLRSEIATACAPGARIFVLGNLISKESLLVLLKLDIEAGESPSSIFRAYPFSDAYGNILWPERFPNEDSVGEFKRAAGGAWEREYLLDASADEDYYARRRSNDPLFDEWGAEYGPFLRKAGLKYLRDKEKAGDMKLQKPLVVPMRRFRIDSPKTESERERFLRYSQQNRPLPEYMKEYDDALKKAAEGLDDLIIRNSRSDRNQDRWRD